jgi:CRISPR-associated protein Csm4
MKNYIYYLKTPTNARFHFGEVARESSLSSSSTYAYSDTLWGALLHNAFLMNKEKADQLVEAIDKNQVSLSSAFFYIEQKGEKVLFLPKPVTYNFVISQSQDLDPKKIKNVEMLSKGVWESDYEPKDWFDEEKCQQLQGGKFICLKEEGEFNSNLSVYSKSVIPKNPISYTENEDNDQKIYYQTDVFLNDNELFSSGYYFLVEDSLDRDISAFLEKCIENIVTFGLGGDRSTGAGQIIDIQKEEFEWSLKSTRYFSNLSLLIPRDNDYKEGYYKMMLRGGQNTCEKTNLSFVQCIADGGVFEKKINGKLVEIGTEKLKNGVPYFAPVNLKNFDL